MRVLFFSLLLLTGLGNAVNGQTLILSAEDYTTGGDGTQASAGDIFVYTITVNGQSSTSNATVTAKAPAGTSYVTGSTIVNGVPVSDVNGVMPYTNGVTFSLASYPTYTVEYRVKVTSNMGTFTNTVSLQVGSGLPVPYSTTTTVTYEQTCSLIYQLTTSNSTGKKPTPPRNALPYAYIKTINPANQLQIDDIYNGPTGLCKDALTSATLTTGSILIDAAAMGMMPQRMRLYFVNKVSSGQADLCYLDLYEAMQTGTTAAYRYTGVPLTSNVTTNVTRMAFDTDGNGYAITENGLEFIHFTINPNTNAPTIDAPVLLQPDPNNGTHDFFAETGGDIVSDGSGKLIFVANSGNEYRIDPVTHIVKWDGLILLNGAALTGCTAVAIDNAGSLYIGGFFEKIYKVTLSTFTATNWITSANWATADYGACMIPATLARVATNTGTVRNNPDAATLEAFAKVQPNPFNKELNVQVQLNSAELVRVRLIDFYGRTVYTSSEKLGTGNNSLHIPVPEGLGSGMYVLELWAGEKRLIQKKLLKQ